MALSYRTDLIAAMRKLLPAQFFSRFAVRQGVKWTPLRTVFAAILMGWEDAGQLGQRFARVCEYLQGDVSALVPGDLLQPAGRRHC